MTRIVALLLLAGCTLANVAQHRRPPLAAYALDFAAFSAGLAATVDGRNRGDNTQTIIGGSIAAVIWLPWMVLGR